MQSLQRQSEDVRSSRSRRPAVRQWFNGAFDLLFPPVCCLCGGSNSPDDPASERTGLCDTCIEELTAQTGLSCQRCARPLPEFTGGSRDGCPVCRDGDLRFANAYAIGVYDGLLRAAVLKMKQSTGEMLTMAMGELLAKWLAERMPEPPDRVVPVPTFWTRRLARTTNCPEILMEVISRRLAARGSLGLLRCRRKTKKQGTLLPSERRQNVRGAYAVSAGYDISGARVLVVDDVMTTGATANEIARVLHKAGAREVVIAAVARGVGFDG